MRNTSRCGLGKTATRSLCMALDKFRDDFQISHDEDVVLYNRGFSLEDAVREFDEFNIGI
jgi:hypothetical protein